MNYDPLGSGYSGPKNGTESTNYTSRYLRQEFAEKISAPFMYANSLSLQKDYLSRAMQAQLGSSSANYGSNMSNSAQPKYSSSIPKSYETSESKFFYTSPKYSTK